MIVRLANWMRSSAALLLVLSVNANAALIQGELVEVTTGSLNGALSPILGGTTTGTYNTATGEFVFDAGTTTMLSRITPITALFTWEIDNWEIGDGSTSATAYDCVEGNFGGFVEASLCGNYWFYDGNNNSGNFVNESSVDYSGIPGTRTIGGDDVAVGPQQQLSDLAATALGFSPGDGTLMMQTAFWDPNVGGTQFQFAMVPVPATAWLFGSALGLLGWMKRKKA